MKMIAAASLVALMTASNADAALLTYNVNGVFEDNSTLTGSFTFNDEEGSFFRQLSNVSIALSAPAGFVATQTRGGTYYTLGGNNVAFRAYFRDPNLSESVSLAFLADYVEDGLLKKIISGNLQARDGFGSFYTNANSVDVYLSSGTITLAQSVPEPATWAMFIGGLGMVGYALRRRQRVKISVC